METALGWLGDIFRAILLVVPRIIIVRSTHGGIKFKYGSKIVVMRPSLHVYWPLVTEIEIIPVKYATKDLPQQYLETKDGKRIGASGIVSYEIVNVKKAICDCWDYEDVIQDKGLAAVKSVVCTNDYDYFKTDDANKDLKENLKIELSPFGINVLNVQLSDFVESRMIALWGMNGGTVE